MFRLRRLGIQRDDRLGDGVEGLTLSLKETRYGYARLHRVVAEGNLALAVCEGWTTGEAQDDLPTAFYDLYRRAGGMIVEHWDVLERIARQAVCAFGDASAFRFA